MTTRVAVVTGAAQGLGRAIALKLAEDGLDVVINDLATKKDEAELIVEEIRKTGNRSLAIFGDISEEQVVRDMIEQVVLKLGGLDVMVANAGITKYARLLDMDTEDWDRIFRVNTRGVMLCYKYAAAQMVKQGRGGRIIGACSMSGKRGTITFSAYSASKFAVRGLTQCLDSIGAGELGSHGITVNTYAPGLMPTSMVTELPNSELLQKIAVSYTVLGRNAEIEEVSAVVGFLASPAASYITGQSIGIDGGGYMD